MDGYMGTKLTVHSSPDHSFYQIYIPHNYKKKRNCTRFITYKCTYNYILGNTDRGKVLTLTKLQSGISPKLRLLFAQVKDRKCNCERNSSFIFG